jgi:hypothetical protein
LELDLFKGFNAEGRTSSNEPLLLFKTSSNLEAAENVKIHSGS